MSLAYAVDDVRRTQDVDVLGGLMQRLGLKMTFAKDEEIYAQDEDCDFIYQVVSGAVRTTRLMSDGRRQIGEFYYAGELFGLEPGPEHRFSAEALCDATVLVLKRTALKTFAGDGELDRAIWEATTRELERAQGHLLLLGRKTACEKVATFLMDLAERGRTESVSLPMSRQDMADYLGLTIETVSRMVSQLQNNDVVEFAGCRQFKVRNRPALARLAE